MNTTISPSLCLVAVICISLLCGVLGIHLLETQKQRALIQQRQDTKIRELLHLSHLVMAQRTAALRVAVKTGNIKAAQNLLDRGADVNRGVDRVSVQGTPISENTSPLAIAVAQKNAPMARLLLGYGAIVSPAVKMDAHRLSSHDPISLMIKDAFMEQSHGILGGMARGYPGDAWRSFQRTNRN